MINPSRWGKKQKKVNRLEQLFHSDFGLSVSSRDNHHLFRWFWFVGIAVFAMIMIYLLVQTRGLQLTYKHKKLQKSLVELQEDNKKLLAEVNGKRALSEIEASNDVVMENVNPSETVVMDVGDSEVVAR